uniref:NADH-ubiquinone oxidoreductase chain 2 n=1 Tax=Enoplometopus debelius TaxID=360513 RepID=A0A0U1XIU0_9EUCA|nr:NADH dehydrogenase subunit 2 [Enoplometopus debelius]AIU44738.1 NADH dehydrogenase subunit 2 [Enoplometopus debelius]
MLISPIQLMFCLSLITGTILSISSSSWFLAWTGLELNLLSFIPIIIIKNNQYSSEAALKYFLIQALGSSLIIFSASTTLTFLNFSPVFMLIALLLKLGAAPFHFWFPQVMEGLNWIQSIILMTIQKLAPMFLISYLTLDHFLTSLMLSSILLSAIIGALMGMNQTLLRKIMAFSSINHMAWMLSAMIISETLWIMYFVFYSIISISVMLTFQFYQMFHISQISLNNNFSLTSKMIMMMSLLSLGGLPPFSGFIPKWILIQEMIYSSMQAPLVILLASTLITLYFYLRISISSLMLTSLKMKWSLSSTHISILTPLFIFFNFIVLFTPSFIMIF